MPCIFSDHGTMKLTVNHKNKFGKIPNTWKLQNILLNSELVNKKLEEVKKYMEANKIENTRVQILQKAAKAVLRVKYIAIQAYLKKKERSQIHNQTLYLKEQEKEQQRKPKASRREIIKIRAEIHDIETATATTNSRTC